METQSEQEHTEWIIWLRAGSTIEDVVPEKKSRIRGKERMPETRNARGVRANRLENADSFTNITRVPVIKTEQNQRFTIVRGHKLLESEINNFLIAATIRKGSR